MNGLIHARSRWSRCLSKRPRLSAHSRGYFGGNGSLPYRASNYFHYSCHAQQGRHHGCSETSAQAAQALKPVAGNLAFVIFALGIIGTGLLAVPVLAGSAAYAVGEAFKWPVGLSRKPKHAKAFYSILSAATALGMGITLTPLDPIRALVSGVL